MPPEMTQKSEARNLQIYLHLLYPSCQVALVVKNLPAKQKTQRDMCLIPGLGRSPRGRHGNPLQYSCLKNPHGQRRLAGYSSWGHKELDAAEHKILYICTRHLCLILSSPSAWKHFIFSMTFSPPLFSPKGWGGSFKPLKIIKEACHIAFLRSWRESQQDSAYI